MKPVLDFLKANWISLAAGVVAVTAIVFAVLFMMDDSVIVKMDDIKRKGSQIAALSSSPKNQAWIDAEKARTARYDQMYEDTLQVAEEYNRREPLLAEVFPNPTQSAKRYEFREDYARQIQRLPNEMDAGYLPTLREIQDAQSMLTEIRRRQQQAGAVPDSPFGTPTGDGATGGGEGRFGGGAPGGGRFGGGPPGGTRFGGGAPGGGRFGGGAPGGTRFGGGGGGTTGTPAGGNDVSLASEGEAQLRAAVRKARSIRMYATSDRSEPSVYISPIIDMQDAPPARDLWYAQVGLWIQGDIAAAIKKTNDDAAGALPADTEANVTNMPVKRLVATQIEGYVLSTGTVLPFGVASGEAGRGGGTGAITGAASFTGRRSDEQFDVVRFAIVVVMDERDLLKLVDNMTKVNFYQLINVSFETVPPDAVREDGFFYGPEPLIQATLTFEAYMARRVYKPMMPKDVLVDLGIEQAASAN